MRTLTTPREVVETLGDTRRVAVALGYTIQRVSNWKASERLPPTTYIALQAMLREAGCTAPASLWSMEPASRPSESERQSA